MPDEDDEVDKADGKGDFIFEVVVSNSFGGGLITIWDSGMQNVVNFWGFWMIALMEAAVEDRFIEELAGSVNGTTSLLNGWTLSLKLLGASGDKGFGFGRVLGGEFWNLHVAVEAVVEPDDEDDCNEEEEKCEFPCILCNVSFKRGLVLIAFASASCIRHNAPEPIAPASWIEVSVLFNVDFNFPFSAPTVLRLFVFAGHLVECCSTGGRFLGSVDDVLVTEENVRLSVAWLPLTFENWNSI